jgi:hypothetical protein
MNPDFARYARIAMPAVSRKAVKAIWRMVFCESVIPPSGGRLIEGTIAHDSRRQIHSVYRGTNSFKLSYGSVPHTVEESGESRSVVASAKGARLKGGVAIIRNQSFLK